MKIEEIIKIVDKCLPPNGVGTPRERLRIELYNDIVRLIENLTISKDSEWMNAKTIHNDLALKAYALVKKHIRAGAKNPGELPDVIRLWDAMDVIKEYYL